MDRHAAQLRSASIASTQSRFFERLEEQDGNSLNRPSLTAVPDFLEVAPFRTNGVKGRFQTNGKWRLPALVDRKLGIVPPSTFWLHPRRPIAQGPPIYRFVSTAGHGYVN